MNYQERLLEQERLNLPKEFLSSIDLNSAIRATINTEAEAAEKAVDELPKEHIQEQLAFAFSPYTVTSVLANHMVLENSSQILNYEYEVRKHNNDPEVVNLTLKEFIKANEDTFHIELDAISNTVGAAVYEKCKELTPQQVISALALTILKISNSNHVGYYKYMEENACKALNEALEAEEQTPASVE